MSGENGDRPSRWRGVGVVVVMFLAAAAFLAGLFILTEGKRRAPPEETRSIRPENR